MGQNAGELIQALALGLGLSDLSLNRDGVCRLVFDGVHEVDLEQPEAADVLYLHAVVMRLPAEGREPIFRRCLEGNFFGRDTGEATLCLDSNREEILLFRRLDVAATDIATLESALADFVARLQSLKAALSASPPDAEQHIQAGDVGLTTV